MYHYDLPQPLQDYGDGWLNPEIIDIFGDYARALFKLFGRKVKWWVTINEPSLLCSSSYGGTYLPPANNWSGYGDYLCGHNILRAHAKAYRIYDSEFRRQQKGKISIAMSGMFAIPKNSSSPEDTQAAERANQFDLGWFSHPVFSKEGDYPRVMKEFVERSSLSQGRTISRLPRFTRTEIQEIRGSFDYFGLNHYTSRLVASGVSGPNPSMQRDSQTITYTFSGLPVNNCKWQVYPEGFRGTLNWLKEQYGNPEIYITENGFCGTDKLDDNDRISYHTAYMRKMLQAMYEDGCNVKGYYVWSIMDNFEWINGYTARFGLVQVDFNNPQRPRTKKLSVHFFKQLISMNQNQEIKPTDGTLIFTNGKPFLQNTLQKITSLPSLKISPSVNLNIKTDASLGVLHNKNN